MAARGFLIRLREERRQRRYPVEFRIPDLRWPAELAERVLALVERPAAPDPAAPDPAAPDPALRDEHVVDAVTSLWRARRKLDGEAGAASRAVAQARRHLDVGLRALHEAGVTVQDHDGRPFDPGQTLEAVAVQPTPGLTRETVLETVRPTVYIHGRHVQMGQVIVGRPEGDDA